MTDLSHKFKWKKGRQNTRKYCPLGRKFIFWKENDSEHKSKSLDKLETNKQTNKNVPVKERAGWVFGQSVLDSKRQSHKRNLRFSSNMLFKGIKVIVCEFPLAEFEPITFKLSSTSLDIKFNIILSQQSFENCSVEAVVH